MTRAGVTAALQYGQGLPEFANPTVAETTLFAHRNEGLEALQNVKALRIDYSPESLAEVERWFFDSGRPLTLEGYLTSHAIGFYFGEVLCRVAGYRWIVQRFVFSPGFYEIGVQKDKLSIMLTKGRAPRSAGNKRMLSLLREFRNYAA